MIYTDNFLKLLPAWILLLNFSRRVPESARGMPIRCELAKKKKNALHFTFDPDPAADRRAADVALQRGLGLLSQRWFGSHSADCTAYHLASIGIHG